MQNGAPTNDLVFSASADGNDRVFPRILDLYVARGSIVADVTYGKGVFWRNVPEGHYELLATDIRDGVDCRDLPYDDGGVDCVVLDPPYMHSPGGTAHTGHTAFEKHYRNNGSGNRTGRKYHDAVLALYYEAGQEAHRVLRERGVFVVKCQDEVARIVAVHANVEINERRYADMGCGQESLRRCFGTPSGGEPHGGVRFMPGRTIPTSWCSGRRAGEAVSGSRPGDTR